LAARRRTLLQVHEVHGDAAFLEEALRLARVLAVCEPEDLGLEGRHGSGADEAGASSGGPESDAGRRCNSCPAPPGSGCDAGGPASPGVRRLRGTLAGPFVERYRSNASRTDFT